MIFVFCTKGFTDDSCIFYSNKNPKQVENDMSNAFDIIGNWLKANKLTLNVKKSNLILFNIKENPKSIQGLIQKEKEHIDCEREVPKLAFYPTRLQNNEEPTLSLRSPNKLYITFVFCFLYYVHMTLLI